MPVKARVYLGIVIGLGAVVLGFGLAQWVTQDLTPFVCCLALSIPAACLKVKLPGVTGTMSVIFIVVLAG